MQATRIFTRTSALLALLALASPVRPDAGERADADSPAPHGPGGEDAAPPRAAVAQPAAPAETGIAGIAPGDPSDASPLDSGQPVPLAPVDRQAPRLPLDSAFVPAVETPGLFLEVEDAFGRTQLRPRIAGMWDRAGAFELRLVDTVFVKRTRWPLNTGAEGGLHAALRRPLARDAVLDFAWRSAVRTDGLMTPDAASGESHHRQEALGRIAAPLDHGWSASIATGGAWEGNDPGSRSPGFPRGAPPPRGASALGWGAVEAAWEGGAERPARLEGFVIEDYASGVLRRSGWSARASARGPALYGLDTFALDASLDSSDTRSRFDLVDRARAGYEAGFAWTTSVGSSHLAGFDARWRLDRRHERAGSSLDERQTRTAFSVHAGGRAGPWRHGHRFSVDRGLLSVDPYRRLPAADPDYEAWKRNRATSLHSDRKALADTLALSFSLFGSRPLEARWAVEMDKTSDRYESNPDPGRGDRPDEDIVGRIDRLALSWPWFAEGELPALEYTRLEREDVHLRAVHSLETSARTGNVFTVRAARQPVEWLRTGGSVAYRDQETRYRFDSTRDEGLVEIQGEAHGEVGRAERPWISGGASYQEARTGRLAGGGTTRGFAVLRRTESWRPWITAVPWLAHGWRVEAGWRYEIEQPEVWALDHYAAEPVFSEHRLSLSAAWSVETADLSAEVIRIMPRGAPDGLEVRALGAWRW